MNPREDSSLSRAELTSTIDALVSQSTAPNGAHSDLVLVQRLSSHTAACSIYCDRLGLDFLRSRSEVCQVFCTHASESPGGAATS